jgi:ankyrin repeat protein
VKFLEKSRYFSSIGPWTGTGEEAIFLGAKSGSQIVLERMLGDGISPDASAPEGETALMWAIENGHAGCALALIAAGCRVDDVNTDGETALMWAARSKSQDVFEALLAKGCALDARKNNGKTALRVAVDAGWVFGVEALAERGGSLDDVASDGWTALMVAAMWGEREIVDVLIAFGCDVGIKNMQGQDAEMLASASARGGGSAYESSAESCAMALMLARSGEKSEQSAGTETGWGPAAKRNRL